MRAHFRFDFTFPKHYELKILSSAPLPHPLEPVFHYPLELEEGDRAGTWLRVEPQQKNPWSAFFALGFDSEQVINELCSTPDPDTFCAVVGGYAYVVSAHTPEKWFRVEQKPVVNLRVLREQDLLLFIGFTSITALGSSGIAWTSERLSWEGLTVGEISDGLLQGSGWDAIADKDVAFQLDLRTGRHTGGAAPSLQRT